MSDLSNATAPTEPLFVAWQASQPAYYGGDAAWLLTSTALVYMMTPALAFFYGGMVNNKNIINTLFLSFVCMGIVTVQWHLFGYSFSFGYSSSQGWGNFNWGALNSIIFNTDANYAPYFPQLVHASFQCAFAVITPALISGAIVGRMKFTAYMIFILLWTTLVYDGLAYWVWNVNGFLHVYGAIDFAGGTVVHISSGVSALVACIVLGKRKDFVKGEHSTAPNVPFVVLGTGLLWIGWIGFNAGSALAANDIAGLALVNTNGAAASALITWIVLDALRGQVSLSGACSGTVVGLVAITPACGYVTPGWGILIGIIGAAVVYGSLRLKKYFIWDDSLDVFTCHGIGGITGALLTGCFCQKRLNSAGFDGAFYGNGVQLWYQLAAVLTTVVYSAGATAALLLILKNTIGIRSTEEDELLGLDGAVHGESWDASLAMMTSAWMDKMASAGFNPAQAQPGTYTMKFSPKSDETGETAENVGETNNTPKSAPEPVDKDCEEVAQCCSPRGRSATAASHSHHHGGHAEPRSARNGHPSHAVSVQMHVVKVPGVKQPHVTDEESGVLTVHTDDPASHHIHQPSYVVRPSVSMSQPPK